MQRPSVLRRVYDVAALFALLHVVAIAGVLGTLVGTGRIDSAKAERLVQVIRGEEPPPPAPAMEPEPPAKHSDGAAESEEEEAVSPQVAEEILRREAERVKTELEQRIALSNRVMLRVSMERETFQRELAEAAKKKEEATKQTDGGGFRKQVEIFEGLSPKVAIDYLLNLGEPDDAARLLVAMDARKAKRIVEAAKLAPQREQMQGILQRVREVAPAVGSELEAPE